MGELSCFFAQNAIKVENVKCIVSNRFVGADKKPVKWEIRGISSEEDEVLKKACTKRMPVQGKKECLFQKQITAFTLESWRRPVPYIRILIIKNFRILIM